jgi:aminomethyltransferase
VQPVTAPRRTPFYEFHRLAGGKLVDFAGFEMPLRYTGDVREHLAVRNGVGLFDITHMGEFDVRGPGAMEWLNGVVTNDVAALDVGQALYSPMCRPDAGIVDDLLVYRYADHYMVVVNASNMAKDFAWMNQGVPPGIQFTDCSDATALLAVQGPRAVDVLRGHVPAAALELGYYRFTTGELFGVAATISRTGYTGEDGFELYFAPEHGARVWEGLIEAGRPFGLDLIGLGARDTLRLEMGYMLYGNDIDDITTPLEAGLGWTVKLQKPAFSGKEALVKQKAAGLKRRLVGFELDGRRVARHGMSLLSGGREVGRVTSGTFSPSLERPIGMGYVEAALAPVGTALEIQAGSALLSARVTARPFHTRGSRRS